MPRFGIKSLLIAVVFVALWFSTFAGYAAARDVRASVLLLVLVASGIAAAFSAGARRAFWLAFFVVMLFCGGNELQRPLNRYVPNFAWLWTSAYAPPTAVVVPSPGQKPGATVSVATRGVPPQPLPMPWEVGTPLASQAGRSEAVTATIAAAWTLVLAALAGLIGTQVYRNCASPVNTD